MECKKCGKDYSGLNGLSVHVSKSHNISKAEYVWEKYRERKRKLESEGYEVTVLWESEIKNAR